MKPIIQGLVKTGIVGVGIAVLGGYIWKTTVHDKKMREIDIFYSKK